MNTLRQDQHIIRKKSKMCPSNDFYSKDWRFFTVIKNEKPIGYVGNIFTDKNGKEKYFTIESVDQDDSSNDLFLYPVDYISCISRGNIYLDLEFSEIEKSYFYEFENVMSREAFELFQPYNAA